MIIKLCVCACSLYCKFYRHIIIACQPPSNPEISHKHLGSSFEFLCNPSSTCVGKIYNFFHYNRTTQKYDLVFQGSQKYRKNALLSFDDGGNYCCSKQCDNKQVCCKRVESKYDHIHMVQ